MNIVLIVGVLLVIVILFLIFRVSTLISVAKESEKKIENTSNKVNAILLLLFLIISFVLMFWYSYTRFDMYNLPVASEHGVETDFLFWLTMVVTGIVFVVTQILLFWFSYRYQYKKEATALFYPDNHKLELAWTVVPAIVLAALIFSGLKVWSDITDDAPQGSEVIEIMGYQFAWALRYPGQDNKLGPYNYKLIQQGLNEFGVDFNNQSSMDDFSSPQMYLPKGKTVLLKIRARDVLHSVYAPHFRLKMDAVPGMYTSFWFTPTKTTAEMRQETGNNNFNYEIACTEICGRGHFGMRLIAVVVELEEYEEWKASQQSMIKRNPDLLKLISPELREVALLKSGLNESLDSEEGDEVQSSM